MFPHYNHRKLQPDTIVGQLKFTPSRLSYTLLSSPQHKIFARNVATSARILVILFRYHKIWCSYDGWDSCSGLLHCNMVQSDRMVPTFRRSIWPPLLGYKTEKIPDYTVLQFKRPQKFSGWLSIRMNNVSSATNGRKIKLLGWEWVELHHYSLHTPSCRGQQQLYLY